eukprot:CAMPEP_0177703330 /NCGR_PEP_ID=MMETSP0484_2-20121128/7615_1 /TAXON_ID=354590 /ORGANISM="Rhodomonas lens, Strain RHODO" /LENGTH=64 /DNA_ID=CAMNT_0019214679 /DNA_START=796 /DNA_END=990 /DNA_ORIENTATION=-
MKGPLSTDPIVLIQDFIHMPGDLEVQTIAGKEDLWRGSAEISHFSSTASSCMFFWYWQQGETPR